MSYLVPRQCDNCHVPEDHKTVVGQRKLLVKSGLINSLQEPMLCNPCRDLRTAYADTFELCRACNYTLPAHGLHCPAGPNPGSLD